MALVTRSGVNIDAKSARRAPQLSGLVAGEDGIKAGMAVRVDSNGEVLMSNASADDVNAQCDGIAARDADSGEPITVYGVGIRLQYDDGGGLTPPNTLFVGATDGRLDNTATTGDATGVARVVSSTDIVFERYNVS